MVTSSERPLTARSVVASTLLGVEPPRLPANLLVRSGELLGIAEGTTRVALSRMLAAGELVADDGHYRLSGGLVDRQARQSLSRAGRTRRWDGTWDQALVVADQRTAADRAALRAAARSLRLAERRPGVWLRPHNLPSAHAEALPTSTATLEAQCERYRVTPLGDPVDLAASLWDLTGWAERARLLVAALEELLPDLEAVQEGAAGSPRPEGLGPAFVVSAAALRHFQADPLLPAELCPADWPGASLRSAHARFDAAFKAAWRASFRPDHARG